jgi:hypothetical protein
MKYLPELASNHDPPDLCLLSSQDYRREALLPSKNRCFTARAIPPVHFTLIILEMVSLKLYGTFVGSGDLKDR